MRTLFRGFGAFVGRIDSEERCRFWTQQPQDHHFDPILLVPVDLSKTPMNAAVGKITWDEVQVDDHAVHGTGGLTSIGPLLPGAGASYVGAAYLADAYWKRLRPEIRPPAPPQGFDAQAREYEFHTVVYWGDGGRPFARYYGFHGEIQSESGTSASVAIYDAGRSLVDAPHPAHTIDLASLQHCDAHVDDGGLTEIGVGPRRAKSGAIYLDRKTASSLLLGYPKLPAALLEDVPFRRSASR